MASTNTNTDLSILSSDIYEVSAFLDQIRADTIPDLDETSSMIGIFGYMNEMFSQTLQNTLIVTAETSNEAIPTRAKFTRNVINHAMNLSITNIYARPASMTMMIYIPVNYIITCMKEKFSLNSISGRGTFILDRKTPIYVGGFEFHLDYDVIINRIPKGTNKYNDEQRDFTYTAMYDLFESGTTIVRQENPISEITNPYITTVVQSTIDGVKYIGFSARLHQVTLIEIKKNILTNNSIENKSITFDFNDQLAAFDVDVTENGKTKHLFPIYEGLLNNSVEDGEWCYYEFINDHTIRILFNRDSYVPGLNAEVVVNIKQTEGSNGNFTYTNAFRCPLRSEKYSDYNGAYALIYPLLNGVSNGGKDCKSIKDLRKIIPREASSRGAIINTTDLQNFFNSIDDTTCRLYFKKKRDNQFERMYYAYIVMKKNGYVYPTNTLPLKVMQDDFKGFRADNNNLVLSPGTKFYYYNHGSAVGNAFASIIPPTFKEDLDPDEYPYPMTINEDDDLVRVFEYISPFLITIDDDLVTSYLMTIMNENKTFKFVSINTDSDTQFISTNMNLSRKFIYTDEDGNQCTYDYKYTMDIDIVQNNNNLKNLVKFKYDDNDNKIFTDVRIKIVMVLYADETQSSPYRYLEANIVDADPENGVYKFRFTLLTDDIMDLSNRINIMGIYNTKPEPLQDNETAKTAHGFMNKDTYAKIFIMADFGTRAGDKTDNNVTVTKDTEEIILYGEDDIGNRTELENIIPTREDVVSAFLNNDIYLKKNGQHVNVVTIIRNNAEYYNAVSAYSDGVVTEQTILRYLRNNRDSDLVQKQLLNNREVNEVIDSYHYEDYSRYTVCNVMSVDGGITFYHDYSAMMRSTVVVGQIQETDGAGVPIYKEVKHTDSLGNNYVEYKPKYLTNEDGTFKYNYTIYRIPMLRDGYLNTEELMQDYVFDLEERRKYITECLYVLEDSFEIDLKFFNTYGPSQMFYYNIPSSQDYYVRAAIKTLNIYKTPGNENDPTNIDITVPFGTRLHITKVKGIWGYITGYRNPIQPLDLRSGWVRLADTTKVINYIDNVALSLRWALEAESSADKYITNGIIQDIKEYIEDINQINELHIPNIITLITNNYREQLVYFEFMNVNNYGPSCQHLYLDEKISADICPEFLNVATKKDGVDIPEIEIDVY